MGLKKPALLHVSWVFTRLSWSSQDLERLIAAWLPDGRKPGVLNTHPMFWIDTLVLYWCGV